MPFARVVSGESEPLLRLHLGRLGLGTDELGRASGLVGSSLLVTAASKQALQELAALDGHIEVVLGSHERASGTALVCGEAGELAGAARALSVMGGAAADLGRAMEEALRGHASPPAPFELGRRRFEWGSRTYLMAILNVTPDSFSDGGRFKISEDAIACGEQLVEQGADILDVGGESTRPGAQEVSLQEEIDRVAPVIEQLARRVEAPISVDTSKAAVADAALRAGATLVNDISGFKFDVEMAPTIARRGAAACAMHIQGTPRTMQQNPAYFDVVGEVLEGLAAALDHAERCGVARERLLVDPGIGFGKTVGHNLFLLRNLSQLKALGRPILVGASRKGFLGKLTGLPVEQRLPGSLAALAAAVLNGADLVRVHDVAESVAAARVLDSIARASEGGFAFKGSP